ncbi:DUF1493 family protein [Erwinia billingiae]|uniref:DUF1493 family protein n=1 Tax=Erwinia billingiae TaxID=182337 RepID=UPI002245D7E5|nr:DUF1493 family protein [Erwinia billingiae]MCX0498995.1 DUF1493 family protein [Erwinia billingiae]
MVDETERRILEIIEPWNGRSLLTLKRKDISAVTSLNGDMNMDPEDAAELLGEVFSAFDLQLDDVDLSLYYPRNRRDAKPLTINMLVASAKSGRWLY